MLLDLLYLKPYFILPDEDELDTFDESIHSTRQIDRRKILRTILQLLKYFKEGCQSP
jgi:hypothetical protein